MKQESQWLKDFRKKMGVPVVRTRVRALEDTTPTEPTAPAPVPTPVPATAPNKYQKLAAVVLILMLMLTVGVVLAKKKTNWFNKNNIDIQIEAPVENNPLKPPQASLQPVPDSIQARLSKTEGDVKTALTRLCLVGAALNQNTYVMANNYPASDLVFIDGQYMLTQLPNHVIGAEKIQPFVSGSTETEVPEPQ